MVLKMPVVLAKHEKLLDSFRTGQGLSFDETGIDHCEMHRHAVSESTCKGWAGSWAQCQPHAVAASVCKILPN